MEISVRNSDEIGSMAHIQKTIIVVFIVGLVRAEITVINQHIGGFLNNYVVDWCKTLGDLEIDKNNVLATPHAKTDTNELGSSLSDDVRV